MPGGGDWRWWSCQVAEQRHRPVPDAVHGHALLAGRYSAAISGCAASPARHSPLAGFLFGQHGHHLITIHPPATTHQAIRRHSKVSFCPMVVMHQYERGDLSLAQALKGQVIAEGDGR